MTLILFKNIFNPPTVLWNPQKVPKIREINFGKKNLQKSAIRRDNALFASKAKIKVPKHTFEIALFSNFKL